MIEKYLVMLMCSVLANATAVLMAAGKTRQDAENAVAQIEGDWYSWLTQELKNTQWPAVSLGDVSFEDLLKTLAGKHPAPTGPTSILSPIVTVNPKPATPATPATT
jgi:hypothetical protein